MFSGAQNITIHGGEFKDVQGDSYEYNNRSVNTTGSYNRTQTRIIDSFNDRSQHIGGDMGFGYPPHRPRMSNARTYTTDPNASSRARRRNDPPQWADYDDDGYENPHPSYPQRRYTTPQAPPQQPRRPQNDRWPENEDDVQPMEVDPRSWQSRPQQRQQRSATSDFDSVYNQSPPRTRPAQGNTEQPFYQFELASQPAFEEPSRPSYSSIPARPSSFGAPSRPSSRNPFAKFVEPSTSSSTSSFNNAFGNLTINEEPPTQERRNVTFAAEPQAFSNTNGQQASSTLSGSSMYTEDRAPAARSVPGQLEGELDDRIVINLLLRFKAVLENKASYRKLVHVERSRAQRLVDIAQALLESPKVDKVSRRQLVIAMQRFSKSAAVYPRSYRLDGVRQTLKGSFAEGAFGIVYKGIYQNRSVCIKAMKSAGLPQRDLLKVVAREAIIWRQLDHPNLLPFYGIAELDVGMCLISPWMESGNVRNFVERNPLSSEDRVLLAKDIAEGLKYLHGYDIIHGDLKGQNVLVDLAGRARLADFGLTSINDPNIVHWTSHAAAASKGGTTAWMPPEVLLNETEENPANTEAADVYAWGCVCYELYMHEDPFKGDYNRILLDKCRPEAQYPPRPADNSLAWNRRGLTEKMWTLMSESWVTDPQSRPLATALVTRLSDMVFEDTRHTREEVEEPGPHARFIDRWSRAGTEDDLSPSGRREQFRMPSLEEIDQLFHLD